MESIFADKHRSIGRLNPIGENKRKQKKRRRESWNRPLSSSIVFLVFFVDLDP